MVEKGFSFDDCRHHSSSEVAESELHGATKMVKTKIIIIKTEGGISCEHAIGAFDQEQDIVVICEACSAEFLSGIEVAVSGRMKDAGKKLDSICPHAFQLIQLPFEEGRAKWIQQGNAALCADCVKSGKIYDPPGRPRIDLIRFRSLISRGEPFVLSSQLAKSISAISWSTGMFVTRTLTLFNPCAIPVTQSSVRMAAIPSATAS